MLEQTKVPQSVVWAVQILVERRDQRLEFMRVYGRERGEYEWQGVYPIEKVSGSRDLLRRALECVRSNGWDWRRVCREIQAGLD